MQFLGGVFLLTLISLASNQEIRIKLSARNVEPGDLIWGPPDPFVNVGYAIGTNPYHSIGRTSTLSTENPDWPEIFEFHYVEALDQRLQFEIFEEDAFSNDYYGTVHITTKDIQHAPGRVLERNFGKGILRIQNVA